MTLAVTFVSRCNRCLRYPSPCTAAPIMSSSKAPDFESPEFDSPDVLNEDARIDACEAAADAQRHAAAHTAFDTAVLQYAVGSCLSSCLDILDLLYIPRESHPISDIAIAHDSWRQEAEPEPCSRDSWLRGAIPEGPLLAQPNTSSLPASGSQAAVASGLTNTPKGSRPPSGTSVARRGQAVATAGPAGPAGADTAADAATAEAAGTASSSTQRRASVSRASDRAPSAAGRSPSAPSSANSLKHTAQQGTSGSTTTASSSSSSGQPKQLAGNQHDAEDRLRQELQVRRQQEAVGREMKAKDEQARSALIAMQKELKGKDYTYDTSGKLVLLNKVNPELLPAPPGPQFKVHTAAEADAAAAAAAAAGGKHGSTAKGLSSSSSSRSGLAGSLTGTAKSSNTSRGRGGKAPAIASGDFKQTASQTQPPVLETLKPAPGVTLRAGAAAKQGPKRESAGQTRAQYQQQAKAQNQQATRTVTAASSSSSAAGRQSVAPNASMRISSTGSRAVAAAAAAAAGGPSGRSTPAPESAQGAAAAAATGGASASTSGKASPAPAQPAAAAAAISSSAGVGSSSTAGVATNSAGRLATAAAGVQRPQSPDVNLVLVSAADWGMAGSTAGYNPPEALQAVHKPSVKQIMEEFGRTTFLPKVRSPIQTLKPPKTPPACTASTQQHLQAAAGSTAAAQ